MKQLMKNWRNFLQKLNEGMFDVSAWKEPAEGDYGFNNFFDNYYPEALNFEWILKLMNLDNNVSWAVYGYFQHDEPEEAKKILKRTQEQGFLSKGDENSILHIVKMYKELPQKQSKYYEKFVDLASNGIVSVRLILTQQGFNIVKSIDQLVPYIRTNTEKKEKEITSLAVKLYQKKPEIKLTDKWTVYQRSKLDDYYAVAVEESDRFTKPVIWVYEVGRGWKKNI